MQRHYLEAALQAAIEQRKNNTALRMIEVIKDEPDGARLDSVDNAGMNFLQVALREGMHEVAMRMLDMQEEFPSLDLVLHQDHSKATPILLAVRHSLQIILVMRLLKHAVEAEATHYANYLLPDHEGRTPLLEAADQSRPDILNALLPLITKRADASLFINYFSVVGAPLHVACRSQVPNTTVIASLINHGGNVLLPDQVKVTPLDLMSGFDFKVINNIMQSIDISKRAPFIPLYRKELLNNKMADRKGFFDLTLMHSLKMNLLARMEFDPAYRHLEIDKKFARLEKGKEETGAPRDDNAVTQAFDEMLRLANSEEAVLAVGQLLSGDLETINRLLKEITDYEELLASRPACSVGFKVLGGVVFLGGVAALMAAIFHFSNNVTMPEDTFAKIAAVTAIELLCIALILAISVATVAACGREPHYSRRDWQMLAAHIKESLLTPLLIATQNELPGALNVAKAIQVEINALEARRMPLSAVKTHAAEIKANIVGLKDWMIRYNKSFTLFALPPTSPVVEVVVDLGDTSSADYEMEMMKPDTRALLGGNNNNT
jgi:hypothetical protein